MIHLLLPTACSGAGFSLPLVAHHDHAVRDGFLHVQSRLDDPLPPAANATVLRPPVAAPINMDFSVVVGVGVGSGKGRHDYHLKLDASTSLTWLQCKPCHPEAKQHKPVFDAKDSRTFHHLSGSSPMCCPPNPMDPAGEQCSFHLTGESGASAHGFVGLENVTMGPESIRNFVLGCAHSTEHFRSHGTFAGVAAMGRMGTSLVRQVASHGGHTRFSYCLFSVPGLDHRGFLRFGDDVPHLPGLAATKTLPPHGPRESEYYVSLAGIGLNRKKLAGIQPEMFARRHDGQGGCVIDPGAPLTVLVEEAHHVVVEAAWAELRKKRAERVHWPAGYELCVRKAGEVERYLPSLSLHFAEETATLVIDQDQVFVVVQHRRYGEAFCLAVRPGHRTVIGAMQQIDTRFVFDFQDDKVHFAPETCSLDSN